MKWPTPLLPATLERRTKRFLAEAVLEDGRSVVAHCANPGSMRGLLPPRAGMLLSRKESASRKLPFTWELVSVQGSWVCVNTALANAVVAEALEQGTIPAMRDYTAFRREVAWHTGTRFDFRLTAEGRPDCYMEVKSVSLSLEPGVAAFPDAVTQRGSRHLQELIAVVAGGMRAVLLFLVVRADCRSFRPAGEIDPRYTELLHTARKNGVEVLVCGCRIDPEEITLSHALPWELGLS
ncbi:MAG: DNA/RNA nuclease SfsA [Magnetococcales bacterium]|nr:DNA/RNA nuclease SfsA [Magnetococcales bacterium]